MSARRDALALLALALAVNAGAAVLTTQPAYMDAYYYFGGAGQLARGRGFTEPYLWNYLAPVEALPAPSHLYWMPLTSLAAAPFMALAEAGAGGRLGNAGLFRAAQIPMVLAASALPVLAYAVAQRTTGERRHALAAALLTLFSAYYFPFWGTTDSFALFGLCAAGAFLSYAGEAQSPGTRSSAHFLSGLLAGLAHLARADGVLVGLCLLAFGVARGVAAPRRWPALAPAGWLLAGYLLVMTPWLLRNMAVVGVPLAPGGAQTLWLTQYNDLFTFHPETLTLARYLAQGWGAILRSKGEALGANLQALLATQASIIAFPFALIGAWRLRGQELFRLAGLYGAVLLLAMSLAFTFPGPLGGYFHSGAALLPFVYTAALVGLDATVDAVARRLKHWRPERSKPVFTRLLVAGAVVFTGARFVAALPGRADAV